jgi:hypothetical protein
MSEYIQLDDTVRFTQNFYHPASGYSSAVDSTPRYYVYEDDTNTNILQGGMTARTDIPGSYHGSFVASTANGFETDKFYDVQVSGELNGISGFTSVKQFKLGDIYDTNVVQVSGEQITNSTATYDANVVQVSGEYVDVKALQGDAGSLTAGSVADAVWDEALGDHVSGGSTGQALVTASGNLIGMVGTDGAALAATALSNATWTDARAGYIDTIPGLSTQLDSHGLYLVAISGDTVSILADTNDLQTNQGNWLTAVGFSTHSASDVYDLINPNIMSVSGSIIDANMVQVSGSYDTLRNFGYTYDGTGYTDDYAPSQQTQFDQLANVGAAVHTPADRYTLLTGTQLDGTYASTAALDGSYHQHQDDGGDLELYYEFDLANDSFPTNVVVTGRINGGNDDLTVWASGASGWEQVGNFDGQAGSTDQVRNYNLYTSHKQDDTVKFRFVGTGLSSAELYIDQIYCSYSVINRSVGYANGAIWIDTTNGTAGTTPFINGTADNPVNTWADALSLSSLLSLKKFNLVAGTSITLMANSDNCEIIGYGANVDLNGQSVSGALFEGCKMSGNDSGSNSPPVRFRNCTLQTHTLGAFRANQCPLTATITLAQATTYILEQCLCSCTAGTNPIIDLGVAVGNTTLSMRHFSGTVEFENMGTSGTDNVSCLGDGHIIINANCVGGTLGIAGNFKLTDNSGNVTISDDGRYGVDQIVVPSDLMAVSGAIQDTLSTMDSDIYYANIKYVSDNTNDQDEFAVQWFKNDQPVVSGDLTTPAISVYNTTNGEALIQHKQMSFASPNLGVVRYNESPQILASGEPFLVESSGVIDTQLRTWRTIVGLDILI